MVRALSIKLLEGVLCLPIKVARHFLEPVTDMLDSLDQLSTKSNEELDDYFKGRTNTA